MGFALPLFHRGVQVYKGGQITEIYQFKHHLWRSYIYSLLFGSILDPVLSEVRELLA